MSKNVGFLLVSFFFFLCLLPLLFSRPTPSSHVLSIAIDFPLIVSLWVVTVSSLDFTPSHIQICISLHVSYNKIDLGFQNVHCKLMQPSYQSGHTLPPKPSLHAATANEFIRWTVDSTDDTHLLDNLMNYWELYASTDLQWIVCMHLKSSSNKETDPIKEESNVVFVLKY